jgi:glucokinase
MLLRTVTAHWRRAASVAVGATAAYVLSERRLALAEMPALLAPPAAAADSGGAAPPRERDGGGGAGEAGLLTRMVMAGDCGGTNTRLQLYRIPADAGSPVMGETPPGELVLAKKYVNSEYGSFVEVVETFLRDAAVNMEGRGVDVCCLACAGGIQDNAVRFTNVAAGWVINGNELGRLVGIPKVRRRAKRTRAGRADVRRG